MRRSTTVLGVSLTLITVAGLLVYGIPRPGPDSQNGGGAALPGHSRGGAVGASPYARALHPALPSFNASGLTVTDNFMPWVCQFCTWSGSESAFATEYAPYAKNMTQLSPEMYYLCTTSPFFCSRGYEGTSNDITPFAHEYGIRALPMLTSATLTTIQGFVDTSSEWTPFINQAITDATTYGYGGYNIDWEPGSDTTVAGGYEYAHFLDQFANATHAHGMILTVDFARWDSNFWNLPAFAQTTTDIFMDMNYGCPGTWFTYNLTSDTGIFTLSQLGEALDPENGCTDAQMVSLLGQVHAAGVPNTEWWALDDAAASLDNAHLWTAVHDFVYNNAHNGTTSQAYSAGSWGLNTNERPSPGGGTLSLFTLGTDEQGYEDASITGTTAITSVNVTMRVSLNPSNYRIYEGNLSATGTVLSSWQLPDTNGTLHLGQPPGSTSTTSLFFELATAPGGSVGRYLSGGPGTFASLGVDINGGSAPPLSVGSFTASPNTVPVGGTTYLNVTAAGGTPGYSYAYTTLPTGCSSSNAATLICVPTASGSFTVTATVTDSAGRTASATAPVTVTPASPSLAITSFTALPTTFSMGGTVYLNVTATGGTPMYTYVFRGLPAGCTSSDTATYSCVPTVTGTFNVTVTVTDSATASVSRSTTFTVQAGSSLAIDSFTATPASLSIGLRTTLSVKASGGDLPYSFAYAGLPPGCATSNSSSLSCTPTASGTFSILVGVTDRAHVTVFAGLMLNVTVPESALTITAFDTSPDLVPVNTSTHFTVTVRGGSGVYTYAYRGLPLGCASHNISYLECTPTQNGTFNVTATVTDSQGHKVSAIATLTVSLGLSQGNQTVPWATLLLGLAVLATVAAIAIVTLVMRRRRRGNPPSRPNSVEAEDPTPVYQGDGEAGQTLGYCGPPAQ